MMIWGSFRVDVKIPDEVFAKISEDLSETAPDEFGEKLRDGVISYAKQLAEDHPEYGGFAIRVE